MKVCALAIATVLLLAHGAFAQTGDVGAFPLREDLARVAPARGPAWWKVSKGDSVVWIMSLPPTRAQGTLAWDESTYRRRLAKAHLFIAGYGERSRFVPGEVWPALPPTLARRVEAMLIELKQPPPKGEPIDFADALRLRDVFVWRFGLTDTANQDIIRLARNAGVPFVRVPYQEYLWRARNYAPGDPQIVACAEAILKFASLDPKQLNRASDYWAKGQVQKMLETTPKGFSDLCRFHAPGYREESLDLKTHIIMEALRRPGHAVAVQATDDVIAEDGILVRLKAKGYTVADPSQPLPED